MSTVLTSFSAASHPGLVRANNEDNLLCGGVFMTEQTRDAPFSLNGSAVEPCLFAVCDGMGGIAAGELASLTAVQTLAEHEDAIKSAASDGDASAVVKSFVGDANERLCGIMRSRRIRLGTTLAMAVIADGMVMAYNIGDSRIYRLSGGRLTLISEEHSLAAQKVKMGLLTEEQAARDKSRHTLTRCLGMFEDEMTVEAYAAELFRPEAGDRLLLCSDGLSDMISGEEIENMLNGGASADDFIETALRNGGRDNVTCIVIDFGGVN